MAQKGADGHQMRPFSDVPVSDGMSEGRLATDGGNTNGANIR